MAGTPNDAPRLKEPQARVRLTLSELLSLYGPLAQQVDRLTVEQLTAGHPDHRLQQRLSKIIARLVDQIEVSE